MFLAWQLHPQASFVLFLWGFILSLQNHLPPPHPLNPIISSLYSTGKCAFVYAEDEEQHTDLPGPFSSSLLFMLFLFNIHSLWWVEAIKPCGMWLFIVFPISLCLLCLNSSAYTPLHYRSPSKLYCSQWKEEQPVSLHLCVAVGAY